MKNFEYTKREAGDRLVMTDISHSLLKDLKNARREVEMLTLQLRNVGRCQDAWTMEALFRRGISTDDLDKINFGMESMEVCDVK